MLLDDEFIRMCVILCLVKPSHAHIVFSWKCTSIIFSMYLGGMLLSQICTLQMVRHFVAYSSGHFVFQNALPQVFFVFPPMMPIGYHGKTYTDVFMQGNTLGEGCSWDKPPWFSFKQAFILRIPYLKGDPTSKALKDIIAINIHLKKEEGHYAYSLIVGGIFHMYDYSSKQWAIWCRGC